VISTFLHPVGMKIADLTAMKLYVKLAVLALFTLIGCTSTKQTGKKPAGDKQLRIIGRWELKDIPVDPLSSEKLYPGKRPYLVFDTAKTRFSGNTGCNSLSGPIDINGRNIKFKEPMIMTKMACLNGMEGEKLFLQTLKETNGYIIKDSMLSLLNGDKVLMQFVKR